MAYRVIGIGEVLWDLLPSGKQVGGAPGNFVYHTSLLGDVGIAASRVGRDALGEEAVGKFANLEITTDCLQWDDDHPTGTVDVTVDANGQPDYVIHTDVAWDFLSWTHEWAELASRADAICFGSLAQRSPVSRETIGRFLQRSPACCAKVFDVNLRQDFFSAQVLRLSLEMATIAKLNDDELPRVCQLLGLPLGPELIMARQLCETFGLALICITRGGQGCLVLNEEEYYEEPGLQVAVADTVGAGDAFTAALVHHHLRGTALPRLAQAANRLGAWVATQAGGTPSADPAVIEAVTAR